MGVRRGKCIFEFIYFSFINSCKSKSKDPRGCLLFYYFRLFISLKIATPPSGFILQFLNWKVRKTWNRRVVHTNIPYKHTSCLSIQTHILPFYTNIHFLHFHTNTHPAFLYKHTLPAFPYKHTSCLSIQTHFLPFYTNTLPAFLYKHTSWCSLKTHLLFFHTNTLPVVP